MTGASAELAAGFTTIGSIPLYIGANNTYAMRIDPSTQIVTFAHNPTGITPTPASPLSSLQYNNGGTQGGTSGLTWSTGLTSLTNNQTGTAMMNLFQVVNQGTGTAAGVEIQLANLTNVLSFLLGSTGYTGTILTGANAGQAAAIATSNNIPLYLGVNNTVTLAITTGGFSIGGASGAASINDQETNVNIYGILEQAIVGANTNNQVLYSERIVGGINTNAHTSLGYNALQIDTPSLVGGGSVTSGYMFNVGAPIAGMTGYANFTGIGSITATGLNGMAIGATTPSTGAFSTISASGASQFGGEVDIASTAANGNQIFNTVDQVTNVEVAKEFWTGSVFELVTNNVGSGTARPILLGTMKLGVLDNNLTLRTGGTTNGQFNFSGTTNGTVGGIGVLVNLAANTSASGTAFGEQFNWTVNQTSTAGYTGIFENVTETGVGSGAKRLMDLQVGTVSRFTIDDLANATLGNFSVAGGILMAVKNTSTSTGSFAGIQVANSANTLVLDYLSTGFSGSGITGAPAGEAALIFTNAATPLVLGSNTTAEISIATSGVTFFSAITPTQTGGLIGTTTNNNATAGSWGEVITATASAVAMTSATPSNVATITLTAGDWDIFGSLQFVPNGSSPTSLCTGGINTTSATVPAATDPTFVSVNDFGNASTMSAHPAMKRVSLAGSQQYWLVAQPNFTTSTLTCNGTITARRVR